MENKYPYIGKNSHGIEVLIYSDTLGCIICGVHEGEMHKVSEEWFKRRYTNITADYLRNTKIRIESPEHSEFVQKLVFGAGGAWMDCQDQKIRFLEMPCLFVDKELNISYFDDRAEYLFNTHDNKEIKLPMPPKQESDEWPKVGDEVMCFNYEENKYLKVKVLDAKTNSDEFAVASITDKGLYGTLWWGCNFKQLPTPQEKLARLICEFGGVDVQYCENLAKAILAGEIEGLVYKGD